MSLIRSWLLNVALALSPLSAYPQNDSAVPDRQGDEAATSTAPSKGRRLRDDLLVLGKGVFADVKAATLSPGQIERRHVLPLLVGSGVTAGLFATDRATSDALTTETDGDLDDFAETFEDIISPTTMTGAAAGVWLFGLLTDRSYTRETGLVVLRAVLDVNIIDTPIRMLLGRERPFVRETGNVNFTGPTTDDARQSFVSRHAVSSWAIAGVLVKRYPEKRWLRYTAWVSATTITMFRVVARDHFLSDQFVGAALGYAIGTYVATEAASPSPQASRRLTVAPSFGGSGELGVRFTITF